MTSLHRIGVIGTGGIARSHVIGYQVAGAEVAALCDTNSFTLAARQKEWDVAIGYENYEDLINDPSITAVSICTPNASHHPITLAAARAGGSSTCGRRSTRPSPPSTGARTGCALTSGERI